MDLNRPESYYLNPASKSGYKPHTKLKQKKFAIYCYNGGPVVCYLNKYTINSVDSTDSIQARNLKTCLICGLARGNPQWPGGLGLSSKSKLSRSNFLVDLKAQSKHRDKNCPIWMYTKLFEVKKWLNMESKTDKESRRGDDITFLSEIITNSR